MPTGLTSNDKLLLEAAFAAYKDNTVVAREGALNKAGYKWLSDLGYTIDDNGPKQSGLYVTTYWNEKTKDYIIAFRGTEPKLNDIATDVATGWDQFVGLTNQNNLNKIRTLIDKITSASTANSLSFTGHSLGGALAQFAAVDYTRNKTSNKLKTSLVTWNSLAGAWGELSNGSSIYGSTSPTVNSVKNTFASLGISATHYFTPNDLVSRLGGAYLGGTALKLGSAIDDVLTAHGYDALVAGSASVVSQDPSYFQVSPQSIGVLGNITGGLFRLCANPGNPLTLMQGVYDLAKGVEPLISKQASADIIWKDVKSIISKAITENVLPGLVTQGTNKLFDGLSQKILNKDTVQTLKDIRDGLLSFFTIYAPADGKASSLDGYKGDSFTEADKAIQKIGVIVPNSLSGSNSLSSVKNSPFGALVKCGKALSDSLQSVMDRASGGINVSELLVALNVEMARYQIGSDQFSVSASYAGGDLHFDLDLHPQVSKLTLQPNGTIAGGLLRFDSDSTTPFETSFQAGVSAHLSFGHDAQGFYINTVNTDPVTKNDIPEFQIGASAAFSGTASVTLLNFLNFGADFLDSKQGASTQNNVVAGGLALDISTTAPDGKLRASNGSLTTTPSLTTKAYGGLNLDLNIDTGIYKGSSAQNKSLPRVGAELKLGWDFRDGKGPSAEFSNAYLDVGSFIEGFAKKVIGPLAPYIDGIKKVTDTLTRPVSVLDHLGFHNISLLDIAEAFHKVDHESAETVRQIAKVVQVADQIKAIVSSGGRIDLGNFKLKNLLQDVNVLGAEQFKQDLTAGLEIVSSLADNVSGRIGGLSNAISSDASLDQVQFAAHSSFSGGGISFPILENPRSAIQFFLGNDVDLFRWVLPKLKINVELMQMFPVFGPIMVGGGIRIEAQADLTFGFDTSGFKRYLAYKQTYKEDAPNALLLQGLYAVNKPGSEISLAAGIEVKGGIDLGIAAAFVGAGIYGQIGLDLRDPDRDGKLHLWEVGSGTDFLTGVPKVSSLFQFKGKIQAGVFAEAKLNLGFFKKTWRWERRMTLIEFGDRDNNPPIPTAYSVLSIGAIDSSLGTLKSDVVAGSEDEPGNSLQIVRQKTATDPLADALWYGINSVILSEAKEYASVQTLKADLLAGNDSWKVYDAFSKKLIIDGGDGNDEITGGNADDSLVGGGGGDTLNNDTLSGGGGNDTLVGDPMDILGNEVASASGDDLLKGGAGNDLLLGGGGKDYLEGGDGHNTLQGGSGDDELVASSGNDSLVGGAGNDLLFAGNGKNVLIGGDGDDVFDASRDSLSAGNNPSLKSDTIYGGTADADNGGYDIVTFKVLAVSRVLELLSAEARFGVSDVKSLQKWLVTQKGLAPEKQDADTITRLLYNLEAPYQYGKDSNNMPFESDPDELSKLSRILALDKHKGVTVYLAPKQQTLNRGEAAGVSLYGIEQVEGTDYADKLVGDGSSGALLGNGGDDTLIGGPGNDFIEGGAGGDLISGDDSSGVAGAPVLSPEVETVLAAANLALEKLALQTATVSLLAQKPLEPLTSLRDLRAGAHVESTPLQSNDPEEVQRDFQYLLGIVNTPLASESEEFFYEAHEAILIGLGNATGLYEEGIRALLNNLSVSPSDGWQNTSSYESSKAGVIVDLNTGRGSGGDAEGDKLYQIQNLIGSNSDDSLIGDALNNVLRGLGGNDTLVGGSGDDTLDGGAGANSLLGGSGDDLYLIRDIGNTIRESADGGRDEIRSGISGTLPENVEDFTLLDPIAQNFSSSDFANWNANYRKNTLPDNLEQTRFVPDCDTAGNLLNLRNYDAEGNLLPVPRSASDTLDTSQWQVVLSPVFAKGNSLENRIIGNSDANTLLGMGGADQLFGDAGADYMDGGSGADVMYGGPGNDTYVVDDPRDLVIELAENSNAPSSGSSSSGTIRTDQVKVVASAVRKIARPLDRASESNGIDTVLIKFSKSGLVYNLGSSGISYVENVIVQNAFGTKIIGNALNNSLVGGGGGDYLMGGDGNDTLDGGAGIDTFDGGAGNDAYYIDNKQEQSRILERAGQGTDTIFASCDLDIGIGSGALTNIENIVLLNSSLAGGVGPKKATGNNDRNRVQGNDLNNTLGGWGGEDTISGMDGDDVLLHGAGNDQFNGGTGFNVLYYAKAEDVLSPEDLQKMAGMSASALSTNAPEGVVFGASYVDLAQGFAHPGSYRWNSSLLGGQSTVGYNETDQISSIQGVVTGFGNDTIVGNLQDNSLNGGAGNDSISGGGGSDTLSGGDGNDIIAAGNGQLGSVYKYVSGSFWWQDAYEDAKNRGGYLAVVTSDDEWLELRRQAGSANGWLGATDDPEVKGLDGKDLGAIEGAWKWITGEWWRYSDWLSGQPDNSLEERTWTTGWWIFKKSHSENVANTENYLAVDAGGWNDLRGIPQWNFNDYSRGYYLEIPATAVAGATLLGGAGTDSLVGGSAGDFLDGGEDTDTMKGGAGDDTYCVTNAAELPFLVEDMLLGGGVDLVIASVNATLPGGIENLTLTGNALQGVGNDLRNWITGNSLANSLVGGGGRDTLVAEGGADTLEGGPGDDFYFIDNAAQLVRENVETDEGGRTITTVTEDGRIVTTVGRDRDVICLRAGFDYTLPENVEVLDASRIVAGKGFSYTGTNRSDGLFGTGGNDTILGLHGDDYLAGLSGADSLVGGSGNDTYVVDDLNDNILEESGRLSGINLVMASVTWTLGDNLQNLSLSGPAPINGTGNALANLIVGNDSDNVLDGANNRWLTDADDLVNYPLLSTESDTLSGGAGSDTLIASGRKDSLDGGTGDDFISAFPNPNGTNALVLSAYGEQAEGRADTLEGGDGADTVSYASYRPTEFGVGLKIDLVGGNVSYTADRLVGIENVIGTESFDTIFGNDAANYIDGGSGADSMAGGKGADTYVVDNNSDVVSEANTDAKEIDVVRSSVQWGLGPNLEQLQLTGSASIMGIGNELDNLLVGNSGNNSLIGREGNDTLDGGLGADTLYGGAGNDVYYVDNAADSVVETASGGYDIVYTSLSSYTLPDGVEEIRYVAGTKPSPSQGGAPRGIGNALPNRLFAAAGATGFVVDGGLGADTMTGSDGNDTFVVDDLSDRIEETSTQSTSAADLVQSSVAFTLPDEVENLSLTGTQRVNGTGNRMNNLLLGNASGNSLSGLGGDDTLDSGASVSSSGDTLIGGIGNDFYILRSQLDRVVETAGDSGDTIQAPFSLRLSESFSEIENLILAGDGAFGVGNDRDNSLVGNRLNNSLAGAAGNDTLDGGLGADTLDGGSGDDLYIVRDASDFVLENANFVGTDGKTVAFGIDEVQAYVGYVLPANVEKLTIVGSGSLSATGNDLSNTLSGNAGNNSLEGGSGSDLMIGGLGDDTYFVDNFTDSIQEDPDGGTDTEVSSVSVFLSENVEKLILTGTAVSGFGNGANNHITGNSLGNTLMGGDGDDTLDGGGGDDTLVGGDGNDTYIVDSALDVVNETSALSSGGIDTVRVNIAAQRGSYALTANVEKAVLISRNDFQLIGNSLANALSGGTGNDTLQGCLNNTSGGKGEVDTLTGGAGSDLFVLGSSLASFYDDGVRSTSGKTDYALIIDFVSGEDTLQLKGKAKDYFLRTSGVAGVSGSGLFFDANANKQFDSSDELLAILRSGDGKALNVGNTISKAVFV